MNHSKRIMLVEVPVKAENQEDVEGLSTAALLPTLEAFFTGTQGKLAGKQYPA